MKTDVAAAITATILEKLEAGTKPWVQPWTGSPTCRPLRHNGEPYRGINTIMLWLAARVRSFASPYWMTYNQAHQLGGQVRRGERSSMAVFYKALGATEADTNAIAADEPGEAGKPKKRFVLRSFNVFNVDQIDGIEAHYPKPELKPLPAYEQRAEIEAFFERVPAMVRHQGTSAFYRRDADEITLPPVDAFRDYPAYASVRAHETAHWTGHKSRLDRQFGTRFGDQAYAFEELVAEIAAAIVGAQLGLPEAELDDHASYLKSWIKVLKQDKNAILTAASKADQAAELIMTLGRGEQAARNAAGESTNSADERALEDAL